MLERIVLTSSLYSQSRGPLVKVVVRWVQYLRDPPGRSPRDRLFLLEPPRCFVMWSSSDPAPEPTCRTYISLHAEP